MKIKIKKTKYKKLCVFDFDKTLFNSPEKPSDFKGNWWGSKISLEPPTVPDIPNKFWNENIIKDAKDSLKNPTNYTILLTGRIDFFRDRIEQLLKQQKLSFKMVGLNEFGTDTEDFKRKVIKDILKKNSGINEVEIWDDDEEKIEIYKEFFQELGIKYKINFIKDGIKT